MKRKDYVIAIFFGIAIVIFMNLILGLSCPFKLMTGLSCPGCGLTRAYIAFLHGDLKKAIYYQPIFWTVPFLCLPFLRIERRKTRILADIIFSLTVLAFLLIWIIRIWNHNDFPIP